MTTRILIVDDHDLVRHALGQVIARAEGLEVVGEAQDGARAIALCRELSPDVILMDVVLPGPDGADTTRDILAEQPDVYVIALSGYGHGGQVAKMLRAGAVGYLLKTCGSEELVEGIQRVMAGEVFLGSQVSQVVPATAGDVLTPREREVLALVAGGAGTREIASRLELGVKTVETHRRNIMNKLGLRSVAELTKYAVREGIAPLEP
jgi:DNA-binding NarL/FixJ family response regulator